MYVPADCGSLKIAYLLKSVWKAGQICSFALQTVFKIPKGGGRGDKNRPPPGTGSGMSVYVAAG